MIKSILTRVKLSKKYISFLFLFMFIASIAEMMLPTFLASMIDTGISTNNRSNILMYVT